MADRRNGPVTIAEALGGSNERVTAPCCDCGEEHEVTKLGVEFTEAANRVLQARGEEPLSGVGLCVPCGRKRRADDDARIDREMAAASAEGRRRQAEAEAARRHGGRKYRGDLDE